ncbi:polysaccharide deacetylase family protein [Schleiferilactobacillus perolens]|jgi:peptidoglycan/xylan/chitin deacetylase (PgdA/CDA1 family)|uniref:Prophage lp2 protein 59 n=1 Tax=Schleiferilactobacillus perolens DSM 12744 TaxID=1423792 RepID=A0A0R1NBW7_9LACO|nr:polysaccharide deacetylase family protein [Schleiferilactobacillus perolens]KRL13848.1 prophage lp2 protein 59 [Schleiferilactobacillus perolens DSM 12744]MCI2171832.1 polysaccharide deacetylase family protein [Schleiferilactobacillus perolens]
MGRKKRIWLLGIVVLLIAAGGFFWHQHTVHQQAMTARQEAVRQRRSRQQRAAASSKRRAASEKRAAVKKAAVDPTSTDRIPLDRWHQADAPVNLPILMYHDIDVGNTLKMPADQLRNQLNWLKQAGYYELTPAEAYVVLKENKVPQDKLVWITFDDGYRSMYTPGLQIFKETKSRVTINEISGAINAHWNLTKAMINEMQQAGVDFASHTVSHLELNKLPDVRQQSELADSRRVLGEILGTAPNTIAYPSGRYNANTLRYAAAAGYQLGLTTAPGLATASQGLLSLRRVRINPGLGQQAYLRHVQTGY